MAVTVVLSLLLLVAISCLALFAMPGGWRVSAIATLGYLVASLVAIMVYLNFGLLFPDENYYDGQARLIAESAPGIGSGTTISMGKEAWPYLLALVYGLLSDSPALGLILNTFLSVLSIQISYLCACRFQRIEFRSITSWLLLTIVLIGVFIWGITLLRDPLAWLGISIFIYACVSLIKRTRASYFVLAVIGALILTTSRGAVSAPVMAAGVLGVLMTPNVAKSAKGWLIISLAAISPVVFQYVQTGEYFSEERIERSRVALEDANSGFESGNFGVTLVRAVIGPFPHELLSLSPAYVAAWLPWIVSLTLLVYVVRKSGSRRFLVAALVALAIIFALAWTSGNYGTMVRLRTMALVALLPVTFLALSLIDERTVRKLPVVGRINSKSSARGPLE